MEYRNSISGEVKRIEDWREFLKHFDPDLHEKVTSYCARNGVSGMVIFEVLQMDSSQAGHKTGLIFGETCTHKTLADICKQRLGDVPSRFAYPVYYYLKEGHQP